MATCNECLHRGPCGAKGGILKDFSTGNLRQDVEIRCGHFKNKSQHVEVVICKECVKRNTADCSMYYECDCGQQHTWETDNDFCSYGERRCDNG